MAQHRTRTPRGKVGVAAIGLALASLVALGGAASAHTTHATTSTRGTTTASTQPVNGAQESATFRLVDDGRSLTVYGTGRGFKAGSVYVSLFYPDGKCSQTEPSSPQTLAGAFQPRGDGSSYLLVRLDGAAYQAVRGHIGSESVRAITAASNVGNGDFSLTAEARACAPVNPQR